MDLGLKGKVAMVAGASKGLGQAVARALAREGARVSMASRNEQAIAEAARGIAHDTSAETLGVAVDVRSAESIAAWHARTVDRFGGVDLLFTNAGGPPAGTALSFDDDAWRAAFELLVLSAVRMVRLAVPSMQSRGGGAIVVSTSSAVKEPVPNLALSNVVRASVAALSKTLANELAAHHIRVNHLLPGRIDTDRVRELDALEGDPEQVRAKRATGIPLRRYGRPAEFAAMAAFLLSPAASYITGAMVPIDGGALRTL
jgi:3-oxoacyl-[acyl-carrier protein] reductase